MRLHCVDSIADSLLPEITELFEFESTKFPSNSANCFRSVPLNGKYVGERLKANKRSTFCLENMNILHDFAQSTKEFLSIFSIIEESSLSSSWSTQIDSRTYIKCKFPQIFPRLDRNELPILLSGASKHLTDFNVVNVNIEIENRLSEVNQKVLFCRCEKREKGVFGGR